MRGRLLCGAVLLAACVPAGPVVRQAEEGVVQMTVFDTGGNGELVDVSSGPGLVVSGAADAAEALRAIEGFCGATKAADMPRRNPDTGDYELPGRC